MTVATSVQGRAEKLLPGGEAVVRTETGNLLVPNAVPGDMLEIELTGKRRGVQRGEIKTVVEASEKRIDAPCPVAHRCGGCALQFISAEEQAAVKSDWVADAFKTLIDEGTDMMPVQSHADRFRRRLRWFIGSDHTGRFPGFYAPASHDPVRHSECMVITPALNALRLLIESEADLERLNSVQAVELNDGIHAVLESVERPRLLQTELTGDKPVQWWWRDANGITRPLHKPVQIFHDRLPAGARDIELAVGPDDFVQGQCEGNRELIAQIQQWAGPVHRIADLFCGIGNLSLPLAVATGAQVFGAEFNPASVKAASRNARSLGVFGAFEAANLFEAFDMEPYIGADLLILDPPRRGAKRICNQIARLLPKKIIMVSCDPVAGARDGALLRQHGYRLKALRALDLFPFAGHVEAMSLWERS